LRTWSKTEKLPARLSPPYIRECDFLIGSFAWGARHWTPISWPEGFAISKAGTVPIFGSLKICRVNNNLREASLYRNPCCSITR
jgi:hypothetical protein